MKHTSIGDGALAAEIERIYTGPLDGFVSRRDAVVKALRAEGRRPDASMIKALRKPTRVAWALDVASFENAGSVERLGEAVSAVAAAQGGHGDIRAALSELRAAVGALAEHAAGVAADGRPLDTGELSNGIMAVIGSRDAFALLRARRLVTIPEGGGLDLLNSVSAVATEPGPPAGVADQDDTAANSARREARERAEADLSAAKQRAGAAERMVRDAETDVADAERKLRLVERDLAAKRSERDRARSEAERAAVALEQAEAALDAFDQQD